MCVCDGSVLPKHLVVAEPIEHEADYMANVRQFWEQEWWLFGIVFCLEALITEIYDCK